MAGKPEPAAKPVAATKPEQASKGDKPAKKDKKGKRDGAMKRTFYIVEGTSVPSAAPACSSRTTRTAQAAATAATPSSGSSGRAASPFCGVLPEVLGSSVSCERAPDPSSGDGAGILGSPGSKSPGPARWPRGDVGRSGRGRWRGPGRSGDRQGPPRSRGPRVGVPSTPLWIRSPSGYTGNARTPMRGHKCLCEPPSCRRTGP